MQLQIAELEKRADEIHRDFLEYAKKQELPLVLRSVSARASASGYASAAIDRRALIRNLNSDGDDKASPAIFQVDPSPYRRPLFFINYLTKEDLKMLRRRVEDTTQSAEVAWARFAAVYLHGASRRVLTVWTSANAGLPIVQYDKNKGVWVSTAMSEFIELVRHPYASDSGIEELPSHPYWTYRIGDGVVPAIVGWRHNEFLEPRMHYDVQVHDHLVAGPLRVPAIGMFYLFSRPPYGRGGVFFYRLNSNKSSSSSLTGGNTVRLSGMVPFADISLLFARDHEGNWLLETFCISPRASLEGRITAATATATAETSPATATATTQDG